MLGVLDVDALEDVLPFLFGILEVLPGVPCLPFFEAVEGALLLVTVLEGVLVFDDVLVGLVGEVTVFVDEVDVFDLDFGVGARDFLTAKALVEVGVLEASEFSFRGGFVVLADLEDGARAPGLAEFVDVELLELIRFGVVAPAPEVPDFALAGTTILILYSSAELEVGS